MRCLTTSHRYSRTNNLQDKHDDIHQVGGSSDEEDEDKNVWVITKEQYSYYVTQFRAMQANPRGVIPGTQVNNSFHTQALTTFHRYFHG